MKSTHIPFQKTGFFSKTMTDYLDQKESIQPYYNNFPNIKGFAYSKTLAEFGGKWTYEDLSNFLYKPKDYIVGTKMNFSGLKKVEDRANLVLFLREQSDNPVPLP